MLGHSRFYPGSGLRFGHGHAVLLCRVHICRFGLVGHSRCYPESGLLFCANAMLFTFPMLPMLAHFMPLACPACP